MTRRVSRMNASNLGRPHIGRCARLIDAFVLTQSFSGMDCRWFVWVNGELR